MVTMARITTTITGPAATGGGYNELYLVPTTGTMADAHDAAADFWEAFGVLALSTNTYVTSGDIELVDSATGLITGIESATTRTKVGQNSGEPLPKATAALVRWRTGTYVNGREIRGRTFLSGLNEAQSDAGVIAAGTRTALQTAANTLVARTDVNLVVYSRVHFQAAVVETANVWSEWAMLRSRRD